MIRCVNLLVTEYPLGAWHWWRYTVGLNNTHNERLRGLTELRQSKTPFIEKYPH